jgi:hypothetical protein
MAQTNLMRADEIVAAFNGATERKYWRATLAGNRLQPEVHFNSRAAFVRVTYHVVSDTFSLAFSKTSAAFGDFLASGFRSLAQVLGALKAAGLPFPAVVEDAAVMRLEFDPRSKVATAHIARHGDAWIDVEPMPFKVPERKGSETVLSGIDL